MGINFHFMWVLIDPVMGFSYNRTRVSHWTGLCSVVRRGAHNLASVLEHEARRLALKLKRDARTLAFELKRGARRLALKLRRNATKARV